MVEQERAKVHLRVVRFVAKVILGPSHSVVLCTLVYNFSFRRPLHACLQLQAAPQSVTVRKKEKRQSGGDRRTPNQRPARNCRIACCASHGSVISRDRKSTRLNSSHGSISYAVFCLKKKKE